MFSRLKLKKAKEHDTKKVVQLFSDVDKNVTKDDVKGLIKREQILVLKENKKIKAAVSYFILGLGIGSLLYVRKLAVSKENRGKGIGSHFLDRIKDHAEKKRHKGFFLCCSKEKARSFYVRNKLKAFLALGGFTWFWWKRKNGK